MSDQSIFNGSTPATEAVSPVVPPSTPTLAPEVAEYVGSGKKYASIEEALKSVPHAQKLIPSLQEELAAAKAELEKRRTTEAILEELKANGLQQQPATTAAVSSISQEDVEKLVQRTISQNEVQTRAANNTEAVKNTFISKFGAQAESEYIRIAQESGLSLSDLNRLSATSPNAVLKLAGLEDKKINPMVTKPTSSINTEALKANQSDPNLSARVKAGASTKDLLNAWKIAGQKVGRQS